MRAGFLFHAVIFLICVFRWPVSAAVEGDEYWDDEFGSLGADAAVGKVVIIDQNLYVSGPFRSVGGKAITNLAKWNGTNWSSLEFGDGGFPDAHVRAMALFGNRIVVGGYFTTAGGVATTNVAQWDGTNWTSVGTGVNGIVFALTVAGNDLLAGGRFSSAGGFQAWQLARWDSTNWQAMGIITNYTPCADGCPEDATVFAIASKGSELFVGGRFVYAGGVFATNIARWDGMQWHRLGNGVAGQVQDIVVSGDDIYVATGGGIARWDGSAWHSVGGGVNDGLSILALAGNGRDIYAGGSFRRVGGISANRVAKWDGQQWSNLGSGIAGGLGFGAVSSLALEASFTLEGISTPSAASRPPTSPCGRFRTR